MQFFELVDVVRDERSIHHNRAADFRAALRRRLPEVGTKELLLAALEALRDDAELRDAYSQIDALELELRDYQAAEVRSW